MKFLFRALLFLALLLGATSVPAATFSQESAAAYAIQHNPDLALARAAIDGATARALHAGGRNNPELEAEVRPNLAGREFSVSAGISQRFPFTHRLRMEKELSQTAISQARIEVQVAERELAFEIKSLVVQWLAVQQRQAILTKQSAASQELATATTRAAAVGETAPLEAAQLDLATSQLSLEALQLSTTAASLTSTLRAKLGAPPGETLNFTGALAAPTLTNPSSSPKPSHPARQLALNKEESARQGLPLAHAQRWEDLTVGVGYERSHIDDAGAGMERENSAVIRFSLPLPLKKNTAAHVAEAEANIRRSVLETQATTARLHHAASAALDEMKTLTDIHGQTVSKLLPQAEALEQRFTALLKSGQTTLAEVLRARQQRLALESTALDARRDFHLARLRYEAASGRQP